MTTAPPRAAERILVRGVNWLGDAVMATPALVRLREARPDARIQIDANGAWSAKEAIAALPRLVEFDIELIEQPVRSDDLDGLLAVTRATRLPVYADEGCVTARDVPRVADRCDGIVVKLQKCGGLLPALEHVQTARAHLGSSERLLVPKGDALQLIETASIHWLEADDNYVHVHTAQAHYLVRRTLSDLLTQLGDRFARIHKSAAVNLLEVKTLSPLFKGDHEVLLRSGKLLRLSRRFKEELFARMGS